MPKKRNCRRSEIEREIHEKAVSLRKLTDHQLIERLEQRFSAGFEAGKREAMPPEEKPRHLTEQLLLALAEDVKGVGPALLSKMKPVIQKVVGEEVANE